MLLDIVIIIDKLFQHWIAVFGCPRRFLGGNGGEFNNELFRNISELLNVKMPQRKQNHLGPVVLQRHSMQ